ncbi:sensor histidine kinase [Roseateles oligotrophus]|uniref:histidine kinase n=1 Tax=Roseateles oligotrophus TaxID=1769250 RepID=A0ABT2YFU8_9BURK|nr:histidine kinase dimerization/phosphoacceptor domain -containing protein [Roseateles oligotrophus]MCV2368909.1 PAS domain S-box protein [Roseateles oligotrophus]
MPKFGFLRLRTLNTRLTLFTSALVVLSIWSLAIYVGKIMHEDVRAVLSERQLDSVGLLAAEINDQLSVRMAALEAVAKDAGSVGASSTSADAIAAQSLLDQRPVLQSLFNGGVVFINKSGQAIADAPVLPGRVGSNYLHNADLVASLTDGRSRVGRPVMGRILKTPVFGLIVSIRDANGAVQGVLVGLINMARPSFLDPITARRFGRAGHYFLVSPKDRLTITSSDPSCVMRALPPLGAVPSIDRFAAGYEGTLMYINPAGIEVLVSLTAVPVANWAVAVSLPTDEAFAPLFALQRHMLLAAMGLSLLAGFLMWWLLQHQLSPLAQAAKQLAATAASSTTGLPMQALPIKRTDEIGLLIAGFNLLLAELGQREAALAESEARYRTMIEWSPEPIAVHRDGRLIFVNPALVKLLGGRSAQDFVGEPVLDFIVPEGRARALVRIKQAAEGNPPEPLFEERCLKLDGTPFDAEVQGEAIVFDGKPANLVLLSDITERKQNRLALQTSLREKTVLLNEVHHRVKNNLQVVSSLLRLEGGRCAELRTKEVLSDMQGRIRAMALLHESLYRSGLFASVNLAIYLKDLAVQACRGHGSSKVRLQLNLAPVQVSLDQATPCGLLLNELISNAFKHGFPAGRDGVLTVELQPLADPDQTAQSPDWRLRVEDDGIGLPADFAIEQSQSLGLQLVRDLSCQLGGRLTVGPLPHAAFELRFTVQKEDQQDER